MRPDGGLRLAAYIPSMARTAILAGLIAATPAASIADEAVITLISENDDYFDSRDRYYTNGVFAAYTSKPGDVFGFVETVAAALPFFDESQAELRQGVSLSHRIFTPDDITEEIPDPTDHPYAGNLAIGGRIIAQTPRVQDFIEVQIGVIGPFAGGGAVQRTAHRISGAPLPEGWPFQIGNEPSLEIQYQRTVRLTGPRLPGGIETELLASAGGALGNVRIDGAVGGQIRVGRDLASDFGPPRIRPALSGGDVFDPNRGWGGYVFVGAMARGVARDIFLDGSTFRDDGPSVDRRPFVSDLEAGFALYYRDVRMSFSVVRRSETFRTQDGVHEFGAVTLSVGL